MRNRRGIRPADLTSLFDVLFILVFVSLVNAAIQKKATAEAVAASKPPPAVHATLPPALAALRQQALTSLGERPAVVIRISRAGVMTAIEAQGRRIALDLPLVEQVPDPDVVVAYLGDRSAALRVCQQAALNLGVADLAGQLVIFAPDVPLADLTVALVAGLRKDIERCLVDQHGVAVLVDAGALPVRP
jgi:hypothetical protein